VSDQLLEKLNAAVKAANEAEQTVETAVQTVETARSELVSRSKAVGLLLLEAKKLHPAVKDFEAFLKRVDALKLSRAYDLMKLAGGSTTDEELRKDARERQAKSRAKKKLPQPATPLPKPEPSKPKPERRKDSVTSEAVTESAEASAERMKEAFAAAEKEAEPRPKADQQCDLPRFDAFDQSIQQLKKLASSPSSAFIGSCHSAGDIEMIAAFLHQVAAAMKTKKAA
jgi:pyruvate/2-oxoglutarate dehydrogenase complex dihydrolipoamide acyltransferase (E2) component